MKSSGEEVSDDDGTPQIFCQALEDITITDEATNKVFGGRNATRVSSGSSFDSKSRFKSAMIGGTRKQLHEILEDLLPYEKESSWIHMYHVKKDLRKEYESYLLPAANNPKEFTTAL